jgi:hypothetical protein
MARPRQELDDTIDRVEPAGTVDDIRTRIAEPPGPVDYDATPEAVAAWEAEHGKPWPGRRTH